MFNPDLQDISQQTNPINECRYYLPNELNDLQFGASDLNFLHLNARSLSCNIDKLNNLLNSLNHTFSVICVSESWLKINSPCQLLEINGYKMLRTDRPIGRGGGVVMYVNSNILFQVLDSPTSPDFQSIFIEIKNTVNKKNAVVGVTYRPPASDIDTFFNYFESCVNLISRGGKHMYLLGDFNINLLSENDMLCNRFSSFLRTYSLYPLIDKPTRVCASSQTLIDNVFTNVIYDEFQSGILYSDISDHMPIIVIHKKIFKAANSTHTEHFRKFSTDEISSLKNALHKENCSELYEERQDVDKAYELFLDKLMKYYDVNIPLRVKKNNRRIIYVDLG